MIRNPSRRLAEEICILQYIFPLKNSGKYFQASAISDVYTMLAIAVGQAIRSEKPVSLTHQTNIGEAIVVFTFCRVGGYPGEARALVFDSLKTIATPNFAEARRSCWGRRGDRDPMLSKPDLFVCERSGCSVAYR
jgi:hypothetical protein